MKALIQRVSEASVSVDGKNEGTIENGLLIFLAVAHHDTDEDAAYLAQRCGRLRVIGDAAGKMNLSVKDTNGRALVVSQFTLYADTRQGNRPSFANAAASALAESLYQSFVTALRRELGEGKVVTGVFGAMMKVKLINDGPVTVMLESKSQ